MNKKQLNWYIQYDYETFLILREQNIGNTIFKAASKFLEMDFNEAQQATVSQWTTSIADSVNQILLLLYNFFYVEQKLTNNEIVKDVFLKIYSVLRVQNVYASLFYIYSQNFRVNRILSSSLRLNRFLQQIDVSIKKIRKNLDKTFMQNLDEVYIYIQQKIKETLLKTEQLGDHSLNIILLDMLSLLLRNFGDSTMHKILDKTRQKNIMDNIQKTNEIYQQFQIQKEKEQIQFQNDQYYSIADEVQEDPNNKKKIDASQEDDD